MSSSGNMLLTCALVGLQLVEPGMSPVKVNEISIGTSGFIELRNTGNATLDISDWAIRTCRGRTSRTLATIPKNSVLPGGTFYLVVGIDFSGTAERQLVVAAVDGTGVTVRNAHGARVDSAGFTENSPCSEGPSASTCDGASLGRDSTSRDTNVNADDFRCQLPSPDYLNDQS